MTMFYVKNQTLKPNHLYSAFNCDVCYVPLRPRADIMERQVRPVISPVPPCPL